MSNEQKTSTADQNDSESEDEDYVPDEDASPMDADVPADIPTSQHIPTLSISKQREVDDAFQDLFGKPYVPSKQKEKKKRPKSKKAMKKKKILSEIFGGASIASKLIASSGEFIKSDAEQRRRSGALEQSEKVQVMEQIKFAGQMMEIKRTVGQNDDSQTKTQGNQGKKDPKETGIDAVLSKIKGPQKITTIDKTNVDWENFKDATGMEEELKKKAEGKDAYLVKKDFLNRVDARRFEQEKDERNRKRAAAAMSTTK